MAGKILYIIGNGFDIAHNHDTSYSNFKMYLEKLRDMSTYADGLSRCDVCNLLTCLPSAEILDNDWKSFEESLAYLNFHKFYRKFSDNYEQWNLFLQEFHDKLHHAFESWVRNIKLNGSPIFELETHRSKFLSFNYTTTLENIYGVSTDDIYYIHARQENGNNVFRRYVFGHSGEKDKIYNHLKDNFLNIHDTIRDLIMDFLEGLRKDCEIEMRSLEFQRLMKYMEEVAEVRIIGHSLASVDMPYLRALLEANPSAKWIRYCHEPISIDTLDSSIKGILEIRDQSELILSK